MQRFAVVLTMWALTALSSPASAAIDSRQYLERAVGLIEAGQYALARTYLEPALIDYRLNPAERSSAYYLRGFSFFAEKMYVSAHKDYNRALEFHSGNLAVISAVAQMHLEGLGVEPNPPLAVALFEQAAEAGHPPAKMRLGIAHLQGLGVEQDLEAGRKWLRQAAADGVAPAMIHLAQSFRPPLAEQPDLERARHWYQQAHEAGVVDALAYLGFMEESGEAGEPDPDAARRHFEAAAEVGSAVAQAKLAHLYLTGAGEGADPERALELFRQAADQGHPTGFMGLAYLYETGTAVPRDESEADTWYRRAAEAGVLDAQLRLAHAGLRQGDLEGHRQAGTWLARAAAQNSARALNDYAWLLATSPFESVRNGQQALTLALQAVSQERNPSYLDTLAAAYAEAGKFDRAVAVQREALALVPGGETELAEELRIHLAAFEAGRPWRE